MSCERFSSLDRLLSTTALVLKFCQILLDRIRPEDSTDCSDVNDMAEQRWIIESQRMLVADKNFKNWQKELDLFHDESGMWRCRGRIQNASVPYTTKHPALLHKGHHLTVLLVRNAHS